jgi:hypothetical protein
MDVRHMTIDFPFNFTKERYLAFYEKVQTVLSRNPTTSSSVNSSHSDSLADARDVPLSPENLTANDLTRANSNDSQVAVNRE